MPVDDLASFLRSRRAALEPTTLDLPRERRRVPGLRREEVATLAGISVAYYTRLEQGQSRNASAAVIDALAQALRLDPEAHAHLRNLAGPPDAGEPEESAVPVGVDRILGGLAGLPACVFGPRMQILDWNPSGHALLAGHLDPAAPAAEESRPNWARLVFTDPRTRELFRPDWEDKTREVVGYLRTTAGRRPGDRELADLIVELTARSELFARLWADGRVGDRGDGTRRFDHPQVGEMNLDFQALAVPGPGGQIIVTFSAAPGSPSATALAKLARLARAPAPVAP